MTATPLLTAADVAERLQLSRSYVERLIARGDIARTQIGNRVRVTEESLAEFIASRTQPSRRSRRGAAA